MQNNMETKDKERDFTNELNNKLAIERTKLSNERTFLSYMRTTLTLLGAGVTIIQLEVLEDLYEFGIACLVVSPFVMMFAIYRFLYNRRRFNKLFEQVQDQ